MVNHIVLTIERGLERLYNSKAFADADHLLEGRFYLALQQFHLLRRNTLELGLELIIESGDAIDLS